MTVKCSPEIVVVFSIGRASAQDEHTPTHMSAASKQEAAVRLKAGFIYDRPERGIPFRESMQIDIKLGYIIAYFSEYCKGFLCSIPKNTELLLQKKFPVPRNKEEPGMELNIVFRQDFTRRFAQ